MRGRLRETARCDFRTAEIQIRALATADALAYWHLRQEMLEREPDAFTSSAEEHRATTVEDTAASIAADPANNFIVGAFVDGELVGTAGFYRERGLKVQHKSHGCVKILDFGLAKALSRETVTDNPTSSPTLTMRATMAGVIMGTAAYMAPEQARGSQIDKRADIWAFGVVLHELLTGSQLFAAETISDTLASVLKSDIDFSKLPAGTPPGIRRLLRRCLERDRKRRLCDMGDARIELEDSASEQAAPAASAPGSHALGSGDRDDDRPARGAVGWRDACPAPAQLLR